MGFGGVKQSGTGWREAAASRRSTCTRSGSTSNLIADPTKSDAPAVLGPGAVGGALGVRLALAGRAGVDLVSFTGSAPTGRWIAETRPSSREGLPRARRQERARRLRRRRPRRRRRVGGASAFSNAGQRCASASRLVVFDSVYDEFRERFVEARRSLRRRGPVISEESLERILAAVLLARDGSERPLGGERSPARAGGSRRPWSKTSRPTRSSPAPSSSAR